LVAEHKGAQDARMLEILWLLEELRVNFFAQVLRTPPSASNGWRRLGAVESLMAST
jgi:ATP-dependent helicase HrpA